MANKTANWREAPACGVSHDSHSVREREKERERENEALARSFSAYSSTRHAEVLPEKGAPTSMVPVWERMPWYSCKTLARNGATGCRPSAAHADTTADLSFEHLSAPSDCGGDSPPEGCTGPVCALTKFERGGELGCWP